ncbi:TauD/TfdA family dioxygenase [Roseomonas terrae]|uniref:TauD/TfdA family dioxygenase n=1 Tax=Neoroseomonas terrae TaxID=424799 RepID=A0ABS5ERA3_9PROT|nr:TauD/TfdA family dioxygenase [Neoroseomonas terrae]MBR0653187.1 TauD/TfdA family dioxygenase [Neoroseomonas terrae]
MIHVEPNHGVMGATVTGIDLHQPLADTDFADVLRALGRHCVLRFPDQLLSAAELRDFSARFGALQSGLGTSEPGVPEVSILSNVKEGGKLIGIPDAGQDWHTDMTYNRTPGFVNALVAYKVPVRDGVVLGATEFCDTAAAYEGLSDALKQRLADASATHDLNMYWEHMRREKGSSRAPLTPEQRRARPPVEHPVFLTHPVSGRRIIYVNPGFTDFINGVERAESDAILTELFTHIMRPEYRYVHRWQQDDLLIWDHLSSWHYAVPDYGPDEHRLMKRCQVMADKIFDPDFIKRALGTQLAAGPT